MPPSPAATTPNFSGTLNLQPQGQTFNPQPTAQPVQMTRAQYQAKYGQAPSAAATPSAPVQMTHDEYMAKYGQTTGGSSTYGASFPASPSDNPATAGLKAAGNLPSSILNFGKGLAQILSHPIKTVEGLSHALAGGVEAAATAAGIPNPNPQGADTQTFTALAKALQDRYGSLENAQRSATNDPFGVGADILSVLSGGATLAGKGEQLNNLISKTGQLVIKPTTAATDAAGNVASQVLGASTGKGASTIKAAYGGSDAFTQAMRGQVNPEQAVQQVQDAVQTIATNRRTAYQADLANIGENKASLDISPVQTELESQLKTFGVKVGNKGKLNFDYSSIANNKTARDDIQGVYDTVTKWTTSAENPAARTPLGIDTLKKQLGDFYSDSGSARALVAAVKGKVSGILKTQVEGYSDMTKKYQETSALLDDIKSATGVGGKSKVDTIFTKLTTAMKADKDLRLQVLRQVQQAAGDPHIMDTIAGMNMQSAIPGGLIGRGVDVGAIYALAHTFNPALIPAILATSPRVVGEFVRLLGLGVQKTAVVTDAINKLAPAMKVIGPASTLQKGLQQKSPQQSSQGNITSPQASTKPDFSKGVPITMPFSGKQAYLGVGGGAGTLEEGGMALAKGLAPVAEEAASIASKSPALFERVGGFLKQLESASTLQQHLDLWDSMASTLKTLKLDNLSPTNAEAVLNRIMQADK